MRKKTKKSKKSQKVHLKIFIALSVLFVVFSSTVLLANKNQNSHIASELISRNSLQLETFSPTPQIPTPSITTIPTVPVSTPPPSVDNGTCTPDSWITNGCTCTGVRQIWVYCDDTQPPNPPSPNAGCIKYPDHPSPGCDTIIREHPNCRQWCEMKPVIYLYPPSPLSVDVSIRTPGKIYVSDPLYPQNGWKNIYAEPNGTLTYLGKTYNELFYEIDHKQVSPPMSGIVIETKNARDQIRKILLGFGLNNAESNEFLDFWIPKLIQTNKPYIFFSVFPIEQKNQMDKIIVNPEPATRIEVIAYFKPLDTKINVAKLLVPTGIERKGFTMVAWGGILEQ